MIKYQPWIVCAACRAPDGFIAAGPRHFDNIMHRQIAAYADITVDVSYWEQGFIDQRGKFYDRKRAMHIVLDNKQPFNLERNGNASILFSEGLY